MGKRLEDDVVESENQGKLIQLQNDHVKKKQQEQRAYEEKIRKSFRKRPRVGTLGFICLSSINISEARNQYQSKNYYWAGGWTFLAIVSLTCLYQYSKAWFYSEK